MFNHGVEPSERTTIQRPIPISYAPLILTPCFPSYPPNHGSASNGAAEMLRRLHGVSVSERVGDSATIQIVTSISLSAEVCGSGFCGFVRRLRVGCVNSCQRTFHWFGRTIEAAQDGKMENSD